MQHDKSNPVPPRRSVLCVPAGDRRRIAKALTSGADEVVIDLEDAVQVADKDRARKVLGSFPWSRHELHPRLAVRVNATRSPWCHRDLELLVRGGVPVESIVLPKVESRGDLDFAERLLDGLEQEFEAPRPIGIQALIETAGGLMDLHQIVSRPDRLTSLIIGYADLASSLGRQPGAVPETWRPAQDRVLVCARAAGLEAVDGPFLGVHDDEPFRADAASAAALGFDAKWAIHPRQVSLLNSAFEPAPEALEHARRVLNALQAGAAEGRGAVQLDGQLLDEAMAAAARKTLAKGPR